MTIGEAARRSGFTVKALRFYDRRGLLPPTGRTAGGYRVYGEPDLARLEFIRQAKALGLTLDAVGELVVAVRGGSGTTRDRVRSILRERIAHVARQIVTLTRLRKDLARRRRRLARTSRRTTSGRGFCTCLRASRPRP
jgi:DNA-binding transcriptional MerR regulator